MTTYPYVPPARQYADTILAFRDMQMASTWSVRVENDPLGPVNKIVTLMCGQRRVKSVLCRVPVGASVELVRDEGGYTLNELYDLREATWRTEYGRKVATVHVPVRQPGWRVEVDSETVLAVTDAECAPPIKPPPPIPGPVRTYRALKNAWTQQVRADLDKLAGRLGYHRDEDCGGWDE